MNKILLTCSLLILLFNNCCFAHDTLNTNFTNYAIVSSSAIISSFVLDRSLNKEILKLNTRHPNLSNFGKASSVLSDNITTYGITSVIFLYGLAKKNKNIQETSILLFKGLTISNGIALVSKTISGRYRPNSNSNEWIGPPTNTQQLKYRFQNNIDSYFSGHAVRIWTLASMSEELIDNKLITNSIYGLAIISSSARIVEGEHWLSDVVTGMIIGYGIGKLTLLLDRKKRKRQLSPIYN